MTITELSHAIHRLVAEKKYQQALDYFKIHKPEVDLAAITANEYLVADMITALRGIKAYEAGFRFLQIYSVKINESTSPRVLNSYGWLLYFTLKSIYTKPDESFVMKSQSERKLLEFLCVFKKQYDRLPDNPNLNFSLKLIEYLFKLTVQNQKSETTINLKWMVDICQCIDPQMLSEDCFSIQVERKGESKEMELASAREDWYAMYSKALHETGRYAECVAICSEAMATLKNMHYRNEVWIKRRMAQCYAETGRQETAITLYQEIVKQKKDWFILKELSECYFKTGNTDKALELGKQAATAYGPMNYKVELIELLGDILLEKEQNELALKHYLLVKLIRDAENWQANNNLNNKITQLSKQAERLNPTRETLRAELTPFWNSDHPNNGRNETARESGSIIRLLPPKPQGVDGFVKTSRGTTCYFFIQASHPAFEKIKIGQKLEFQTEQAPKGLKAVKIKILE